MSQAGMMSVTKVWHVMVIGRVSRDKIVLGTIIHSLETIKVDEQKMDGFYYERVHFRSVHFRSVHIRVINFRTINFGPSTFVASIFDRFRHPNKESWH